MMVSRSRLAVLLISFASLTMCGCPSSDSDTDDSGTQSGTGGAETSSTGIERPTETWPDYPDVPFVAIMEEVDGIPIPRVADQDVDYDVNAPVPVDVGNEFAAAHPGPPATGDWLTLRAASEPESLNSIIESSAIQTYIVNPLVCETLAEQNQETFEFEPKLAERWVIEDSVKLSPTYPGHERLVVIADREPATDLTLDYTAGDDDEPATISLTTTDGEGRPLGNVWVGLFPSDPENMPGAPGFGYHKWSDESGALPISGIVDGPYDVLVGAEIYGNTTLNDDGSLSIVAGTDENPLSSGLAAESGELQLAEGEWVNRQEQTVFTYYLREDAAWSDGVPFTSQDLEFGYAVLNNEYVDGQSIRSYYEDLIECTPLGPHVVRMQYRQQYFKAFEFTMGLAMFSPPWHQFEQFFADEGQSLTLERLSPDQEEQTQRVSVHGQQFGKFFNTDQRYNEKPLGTGPYVVHSWDRSVSVELRRRDDYWDSEGGGYLDRIIFKFIPDDVTTLQALRAGEIDFYYRMNAETYFTDLAGPPEWFSGQYVKAEWYTPAFSYVGWNLLRPKFQDRRVRLALKLLFDAGEFVEKKLHGAAVLVSGSQYYFGPGTDHEVGPVGYDPETAADLLADAGWVDSDNDGLLDKDGEPFTFEFLLPPGNTVIEEQAALIQRSLKQAGIEMEIRTFEWASFLEKIRSKDYDVCRLSWAQPLESDPYQIWHGSQAGLDKRGSNHVSFSDPLADELIEMLRVTLDEEKRKRIHWSFQRILDREQPYMFLYAPKEFGAYHQRFQGVKWFALRPGFDLREWYVPADQQLH